MIAGEQETAQMADRGPDHRRSPLLPTLELDLVALDTVESDVLGPERGAAAGIGRFELDADPD